MDVVQRAHHCPFVLKKLHDEDTAYSGRDDQVLCLETQISPVVHELCLVKRLIQIPDDLRRKLLDVSMLELESENRTEPPRFLVTFFYLIPEQGSVDHLADKHDDIKIVAHVPVKVLVVLPNKV